MANIRRLNMDTASLYPSNNNSISSNNNTSINKLTPLPGYISLTSDEEDDDDDFDMAKDLKLDSTLFNKKKISEPASINTSINNNNNNNNVNNVNNVNNNNITISTEPPIPIKNINKRPNLAFKYGSDDDNDNDSDDDDDIIITGIAPSKPPSISTDNSFTNLSSNSLPSTFNTQNNNFKREMNDDISSSTRIDDLKRQQILANKQSLVEQNIKRENEFQQSLLKRELDEINHQNQLRINNLLKNYPPIKQLPEKYQIPFPSIINNNLKSEPFPILPNTISWNEIQLDISSNLPPPLCVMNFRDDVLFTIHSLNFRIMKFNDLYSRIDIFLKNVTNLKNQITAKAKQYNGNKKADLRYNQILRFINSRLTQLSRFFGEVGLLIDRLKSYKLKTIENSKKLENLRIQCINSIRNGSSLASLTIPSNKIFMKLLPEVTLMNNTIRTMYQFQNYNSDPTKTLREFSLSPPALPKIPLPNNPMASNLNNNNNIPMINNNNYQIPSNPFSSNQIFEILDNNMRDDTDDLLPFSNIYSNGGNNAQNDEEGIKNLMESIKASEIEEEGLANTPKDLAITLLKHQRIGLSWMLKIENSPNKGGILADDMGLGKTVQAISLIVSNKSKDDTLKTTLIVGPVSLLQQWQQEINMKLQSDYKLTTFLYHSSNKVKSFNELSQFDVVLISYQTLGSEWKKHYGTELDIQQNSLKKKIKGMKNSPFYTNNAIFHRIILDEAQFIKNRATIASKAVSFLTATYRWCLSGTPIQNKIEELYPLIRFLDIKPYNDWNKFNNSIVSSFNNKYGGGGSTKKIHALLSAILLRRTKDDEIDGKPILSLPEKHVTEVKVQMGTIEKEFYDQLENKSAKTANNLLNSRNTNYSSILTMLLRMRQSCDHQYLVRLGDDGDRVLKLDRFKNGFESIKEYSENVYKGLIAKVENDESFNCMVCNQDLTTNQTLLMSKCGHTICYDCHDEFFEDNCESKVGDDLSAKCNICGIYNSSTKSVDLQLFNSFVEGLTWQEIRKKFDLDSKASDKNWRMKTLQKFIAEDGGNLLITAKMNKTIDIIKQLFKKSSTEKIIVFSQFIGYFDLLKILLSENNFEFLQYDGSMDINAKNDCINSFYKDPMKRILLLSLKAGNVGLTLTCANHVIISEPFWNPFVEKQAQDRVHRISQTKEVFVHRLLIEGTVEDRIMELQREKEEMVGSALDPNARRNAGKLSRKELGFLFGLNGLANLENE